MSSPPRRWRTSRVAHPTRDLDRSIRFYRDVLGLTSSGGFREHDGYDGEIFALPSGGELELTASSVLPAEPSAEDLLVLFVDSRDEMEAISAELSAVGTATVAADNPYWNRYGRTFLDPDGYRVIVAVRDDEDHSVPLIDWYDGPRSELRDLFAEAEDSTEQLDAYLPLGRVLVARRGSEFAGHLQLIPTDDTSEIEIKNMAVRPHLRGTGIGRALVAEAVRRAHDEGRRRMLVATAAADAGNLRFYQRNGFRLVAVERDAFTPETGYPDPILIDGIELRDRVWLDMDLRI
ncbi:MAG TPA: GNAT family N-acetyltransferase [Jatrophihabitantaceae bacterium]|nr:GNAT family N-acetyltransferase [Jatrophihabitantaceae bacterium]